MFIFVHLHSVYALKYRIHPNITVLKNKVLTSQKTHRVSVTNTHQLTMCKMHNFLMLTQMEYAGTNVFNGLQQMNALVVVVTRLSQA